jgi:hypothetical protein
MQATAIVFLSSTIFLATAAREPVYAETVLTSQQAAKALSLDKLEVSPAKIPDGLPTKRRIRSKTCSS